MNEKNLIFKQVLGGAFVACIFLSAAIALCKYPNPRVSISEYFAKKMEVQYAEVTHD